MLTKTSGQVLLISVFIAVLLALTIPILIFLNQNNSKHQNLLIQRSNGINIAQQGIAYAESRLGADWATWNGAMKNGTFPNECNTGTVTGPNGSQFYLQCSIDKGLNPGLQNYQVAVTATALTTAGQPSSRGLRAYVSQATLAAGLPNGQGASLALQLMNTPPLGHTVEFFLVDCTSCSAANTPIVEPVPGGAATWTPTGTPGTFSYMTLPTPITLYAGNTYFLVSHESVDHWYDNMNTVLNNTTGLGLITGTVFQSDGLGLNGPPNIPTAWNACFGLEDPNSVGNPCGGGTDLTNHSYVPVNFQYLNGGTSVPFASIASRGSIRPGASPFTGLVGMILQPTSNIVVTGLGHVVYGVIGNGTAYTVEWGPIGVLQDSNNPATVWDMPDNTNMGGLGGGLGVDLAHSYDINAAQFPRKFSIGGITGESTSNPALYRDPCCSSATTNASDGEEYWAFTPLGVPPAIDFQSYLAIAESDQDALFSAPQYQPLSKLNGTYIYPDQDNQHCVTPGSGCGYFEVAAGDTAVFTNGVSQPTVGFQMPSPTAVIIVDGSAEFDNIDMILKQGPPPLTGAVIIKGNLTLGPKLPYGPPAGPPYSGSAGVDINHHNAYLFDYPYGNGSQGIATNWQGPLSFEGFLYVMGNLYVDNAPPSVGAGDTLTDYNPNDWWWVIDGALRVDGTMFNEGAHNLFLVYDGEINHQVRVQPLALQVDQVLEVGGQSN